MYRRILTLASPTVAAMISQTVINQADHVLVGRLPANEIEAGQSALQVSLIFFWAVGGSLSAIAVGTQTVAARRLGEGRDLDAGKVLANSLAITLTLGTLASILFWFLAPKLFPIMNHDDVVVALGVPYLRWRYLGVLAMVVTASYKSFFDGLGQTYVHLAAAVTMNVVNFVMAYGLIFGRLGMPRMGVEGAGVASCVSSFLGMLVMVGWSFRRSLRERFQYYQRAALDGALAREIGSLSWPSAVAVVLAMSGFGLFLNIVGRVDIAAGHTHGHTVFTTATANLINIFQLVFISCIAYGTATSTLVGQSMGAREFDLAQSYAYKSAKLGFGFFAVMGAVTIVFAEPILHFFCGDAEVVRVATPLLRVMGGFEPIACIALVFTYALYGAGNPRFVMLIEGGLHFTCLVPASWLLGITFHLGLWGCWIAMMGYVALMAAIMFWKFSTGTWKDIKI